MTTHATANQQWDDTSLAQLKIENGFYLRGLEVTRLDTFVDATFAFVLTLLVISFDALPTNYQEMLDAIKRIPAFFASFSALMAIWFSHRRWSRRYALENRMSIVISLSIVFVILVYVYPLRMIFESMFYSLSNGYLPSSFAIQTHSELRGMFLFYSIGYATLTALFALLYYEAVKREKQLALTQNELKRTRHEMFNWLFGLGFAIASCVIAITIDNALVVLAGYIYFLMFLVQGFFRHYYLKN